MSQFSLSWTSYKDNVCKGLCSLQERGEFVDMTLAADGHFVKVHQMIISLASPYLKELITSAPCPHPVIFLNKISYPILCCILEYIYSGEVLINKENLSELIEAGKALHIKGLQDMSPQPGCVKSEKSNMQFKLAENSTSTTLVGKQNKIRSRTSKDPSLERHIVTVDDISSNDTNIQMKGENVSDPFNDCTETFHNDDDDPMDNSDSESNKTNAQIIKDDPHSTSFLDYTVAATSDAETKTLQYALSNKGSLQLILNRFVYCLRYVYKNSDPPIRQWRCSDYEDSRCPATVTTKDDMVVQRVHAHKHPLHDQKILKKMKAGVIFSAVKEAEKQGKLKKHSGNIKAASEQT